MRFSTKAIHIGQSPDVATGAIMTPIYQTSTYVQKAIGVNKGFVYSRTDNPTRKVLEQNLAALENGAHSLCFASGLAAVNTVLNLLSGGDHIISANDLYGGSYRIFTAVYQKYGLSFDFVDTTNLSNIEKAITINSKLLWLETPSNPLLKITDIRGAVALAKKHHLICVVDNTFATPCLQLPLDLGADIVLQSTTKYLGGHSDIIGGALITNRQDLYEKLKFYQNAVGGVPGPLDCFLVLRGTKTLALRMERHCENAQAIARFLQKHPKVKRVYYPGLASHPGHSLAKKQMRNFGGMVSLEVKSTGAKTEKFVASTKLFALAESLGTVRSLINHPATMTHASVPPEVRKRIGITDNIVRLSIGLEDYRDLIDDLKQAFKRI
ncbi:MAG: cystathionine gamma-synthase [Planctomycetota bacterium]